MFDFTLPSINLYTIGKRKYMEDIVQVNLMGDLDILRRSVDRLQRYGEDVLDHNIVTMSLHLQDQIHRLYINYLENKKWINQ